MDEPDEMGDLDEMDTLDDLHDMQGRSTATEPLFRRIRIDLFVWRQIKGPKRWGG